MSTQQQGVLNCSFPLWYQSFQDHTIESISLKVPKIFVDYLLADGLFLPDETQHEWHDNAVLNEEEAKFKTIFTHEDFIALKSDALSAIRELGGKVFPKLNWSSPQDASWIAVNGSLCCENFNDICLLLKSSEFVTHDLTDPFQISSHVNESSEEPKVAYALVLRKWTEISPSGEYRCFVRDNKLIAISQRSTQYFSFINPERDSIVRKICRFHKSCVHQKFPNKSYVMDLYLAGSDRSPIIIDFNPFVSITDGLLFTWEELEDVDPMPELENGDTVRGLVFRSVPVEGVVSADMRSSSAFPVDFKHLATGEDPAKLIDLLKLQQRANAITPIDSIDSD